MPPFRPETHRAKPFKADERHRPAYAEKDLTKADQIRHTFRWIRLSRIFRRKHPVCFDPFGHHLEDKSMARASEVHHIQGIASAPALAYHMSNLAALCRLCHERIEALERTGKPTGHLFSGDAKINKDS